jgi:hypothetical protein
VLLRLLVVEKANMQQVHLLVQQEGMEVREQGVLVLVGQVVLEIPPLQAHHREIMVVLVQRTQTVPMQVAVEEQGQLVVLDLLEVMALAVQVVLGLLMTLQAHR